MAAYYNEIDPNAAAWLRELIARGLIAPGDVDTRSIVDVRPDDLAGYAQCHFFAGIGVWSHALRSAGWSDDRSIWTGSCPCQPFSAAGKGGGFDDERHLWPAFHHLIAQCRPDLVLGEQVASKDGLGWLDLVHADLEGEGYAVGAVDTCAAGFGAPHIRQRLYWSAVAERLADPESHGHERGGQLDQSTGRDGLAHGLDADRLALAHDTVGRSDIPGGHVSDRPDTGRPQSAGDARLGGGLCGVGHTDGVRKDAVGRVSEGARAECAGGVRTAAMGLPLAVRGRPHPIPAPVAPADGPDRLDDDHGDRPGREVRGLSVGQQGADGSGLRPGPTNGIWGAPDWLHCRDGRWRPVEPGTFPLAHGAAARVGRLRGYGNAIVAPQAQAFVEAVMEAVS